MQVYVVQSVLEYEHGSFLGVYASEESARQAIAVHYRRGMEEDGCIYGSHYAIVACQMGEEVSPFSEGRIIVEISEL